MKVHILTLLLGVSASLAACTGDVTPEAHHDEHEAAPTNRVEIPATVRSNLGITFATVERRRVASTLRVPGRFELLPNARREYRTPIKGRIDVLVTQYQEVSQGDVLYRIDSPDWRELQRQLAETQAAVDIAEARLHSLEPVMQAHKLHEQGLREAVELWTNRVTQLKELGEAGGGRAAELAEAQANLTDSRAAFGEVMEKDAELQLRQSETESELRSAKAKFELLQMTARALLGVKSEDVEPDFWSTIDEVEVRASIAGVIERLPLTNGAWVEAGELVLSSVDPSQLRFRAVGLQSDLQRLHTGLDASIVPPSSKSQPSGGAIATTIEIGLDADPEQRTFELLAVPSRIETWTRPGVAAFLEIATEETSTPELAVPLSAVVRDGLTQVMFRRDPSDPNKAIRIKADLGLNDGRWVVVNSGVMEGDEIVLDGVYQLLLATSGTIAKGGHFHADGTFHEEDHDE